MLVSSKKLSSTHTRKMHWRRPAQSGTVCFPAVQCIMQEKQTWCRHRIMKVRLSFAGDAVCPAWCCGCGLNALQKAGESSGQQLLSHGNQTSTANRDRHGALLPRATNTPLSTSQSAWLCLALPSSCLALYIGVQASVRLGQALTAPGHAY